MSAVRFRLWPPSPTWVAILLPASRAALMERNIEQRVLVSMRKLLAQIVREVTPQPGMKHPLSESTIQDIRKAFELISARERELLDDAGLQAPERPRYADEPKTTHNVSLPSKKEKRDT